MTSCCFFVSHSSICFATDEDGCAVENFCNTLLRKYDIKEASTYLESPISKSKWSSVVKSKVRE